MMETRFVVVGKHVINISKISLVTMWQLETQRGIWIHMTAADGDGDTVAYGSKQGDTDYPAFERLYNWLKLAPVCIKDFNHE
jgi:hypothetical protein